MIKFKDIIEVSAETKARMKRDLDKSYAKQLKTKYGNAASSLRELAFDLENKVQTVDPKIAEELMKMHKQLKKFEKKFGAAIADKTK